MTRAEQIRERHGEIEARLHEIAEEFRKFSAIPGELDEPLQRAVLGLSRRSKLEEERQLLTDERCRLGPEYQRLPKQATAP
jgi:hypothetical protein